jgi:hypothetical protein
MNSRSLSTGVSALLLFLSGCGSSDGLNRGGDLSGKVTIDGQLLGGGRVDIYSEDGKNCVSCQIRPDGSYTLAEPPPGPCKLTVVTSHLKDMPPVPKGPRRSGQGASAGMMLPEDVGLVYTPVPTKYEDLATTDLTVTVQKGKQTFDITLTGKP